MVAGSLPAVMAGKGERRLAGSPYDNHIRQVRTTVLKLLVDEKQKKGGLTEKNDSWKKNLHIWRC